MYAALHPTLLCSSLYYCHQTSLPFLSPRSLRVNKIALYPYLFPFPHVFPYLTMIQLTHLLYPSPLLSSPPLAAQEGAMAMADAIPMGLRDGQSLPLYSLLPLLPTIAIFLPPSVAIRSILSASTAFRSKLMLFVRLTQLCV
jgi:hypothetical protein